MNTFARVVLIFFLSATSLLTATATYSADSPKAKINLISNLDSLKPGVSPILGVHFILPNNWETFWRNPGDVGYGVKFNWEGSENIKQADVLWPVPEHANIFGYHLNVYKNEVLFPVKITPVDASKPLRVKLKLDYLLCQPGACIPHEEQLNLTLAVGNANLSPNAQHIDQAMKTIPSTAPSRLIDLISVKREAMSDTSVSLKIDFKTAEPLTDPDLFVEGPSELVFSAPQLTAQGNNKGTFIVKVTKNELSDSKETLVQLLRQPLKFTLLNNYKAVTITKTVESRV